MIRTDYSKSSVTYKFILYKMKMLVTDNRGRLRYLESLDNIFYDVFGIKNTMKKINNAYDPREISSLIDNLGVNILLQLFNSGKMYKILEDLVQINYRMNVLKKDIRKQSRKDKRDKDDVKEYNYLVDLYKKTIKYIRNKFGIKNVKTSYKRKYQSLNNIVKNKGYSDYWDDDDESFASILMRDDDYYFSDLDDDDEDFDDSTSTLDDFVKMLHEEQGISSRKPRRKYHDSFDDDDENLSMFDDDEEDYEYSYRSKRYAKKNEYEEIPPSIDDGLHEQIADLTDAVADISSAVQHLLMKDEYDSVQRKRDVALRDDLNRQLMHMEELEREDDSLKYCPSPSKDDNIPPLDKEVEILTSLVGKMQKDQTKFRSEQKSVSKSIEYLINMMGEFAQKQDILAHAIFDDIDDEETAFSEPVVRDDESNDGLQIDQYYEEDDEEPMSREELVDLINSANSSEKNTTIEATQTSVKIQTGSTKEETDIAEEMP